MGFPVAALPSTPAKRNSDVEVESVIRKLNDDYGLGIEVPDLSFSPARRKELAEQNEEYARWYRIWRGIHFLYHQRDDSLQLALESFFNEAKAASLRWVPKPRADPNTLPSSRVPPKARTPGQQWSLQSILIEVIDSFRPQATSVPALLLPRPGGGPATNPRVAYESDSSSTLPDSPASTASKRSFGGDSDQDFKRMRSRHYIHARDPSPSPTVLTSALDNVPSRRRLGHPPVGLSPERRQQDAVSRSSTDTPGSSRGSNLFSTRNGQQSNSITTNGGGMGQQSRSSNIVVPRPALPTSPSSGSFTTARGSVVLNPPAFPQPARQSRASPSSDATVDKSLERLVFDRTSDISSPPINTELQARLQNIWPKFPRWLHDAPLAVAWEITRVCLHCNVDLEDNLLQYNAQWATSDISSIWRSLSQLDVFRGKSFPERPSAEAFAAALTGSFECRGRAVVLAATLQFNENKTGPLFLLNMQPLHLEDSCRLTRRFGADRFLEILVSSPTAAAVVKAVKDEGVDQVIRWLSQTRHSLVGRQWQAYYTKDAGYRKPAKDVRLGPDAKPVCMERVHFFAESGHNFRRAPLRRGSELPLETASQRRTEIRVSEMLDWLLQLERNEAQPHLKLFSRIQLGLSKTTPTVTFEPHQIRHHDKDILSPIGKEMNDGIGRMSRSVARKIRDALGLIDIPSAIQGRMGSAKGMWLMDVADTGDEDWIETYPSQRKWKCDYADPFHRTLDVREYSKQLVPAGLNLQFLPVLEDRARDKKQMRQAIADRLMNDLEQQFESQKTALMQPLLFRQWVNENSNNRGPRVSHGQVPFLGGLPESQEEILSFLLNSGFDRRQKYVQDLAWKLQLQRCETLRTKLNIKVGRSAYILMVVDFWDVLEEGEVHLGFSSNFRDMATGESFTLLADCDVLVARSPAHFPSDVQKVRAVFKSELHALKDVIVFSAKGDVPLADKLSGGDYDGDKAWVCWDPSIVENFVNTDVPPAPDAVLDLYLGKDKTTFGDLVHHTGQTGHQGRHAAVYDMVNKSFQFAMQRDFLGICTNYKERLCYHRNNVNDDAALLLSSLVGKLVDASKQGIIFNAANWEQMRREQFGGQMWFDEPAYKCEYWDGRGQPQHIIDHLKFTVAKPTIDDQLESLHLVMKASSQASSISLSATTTTTSFSSQPNNDEDAAHYWDPDLVIYYEEFKKLTGQSRSFRAVLDSLQTAIGQVQQDWTKAMAKTGKAEPTYPEKVRQLYEKWCAIEPRAVGRAGSNRLDAKSAALLEQSYLPGAAAGTGFWALLRASTAFKMLHKRASKFVWQMAGAQLAFIKAQMTAGGGKGGSEGVPLLITPLMYAGLMPDGRFVKQYIAGLDGEASFHDFDPNDEGEGQGDGGGDDDE
ncbi:RNA dependent RNA polymerase-domain-containing protein [Chaetomium strumarium]|uniref:RNA-dependent RNA polymerase n=1 Tax=Chaetomium strumarium TaxID=1170767 RepID=A0AAJ0LYV0_9PEZI|nr:RNA dependent RNA polymerase-domain-containing protein [Chaetomium strumarium]